MTRQVRRQQERARIKEQRRKVFLARKDLREEQQSQGLVAVTSTISNGKCEYETVEEEKMARQEATTEQLRVFQSQLPILLRRLSRIKDFRNPKKVKHQLTLVVIFGMLAFVYQMVSRREANRKMTRPMFMEHLRYFFPELEALPHHDTVERVLSGIEVDGIEQAHLDLVKRLIRKKKFNRFLVGGCYPIAIDGTQKLVRKDCVSEEWLQRKVGNGEDEDCQYQYYVYVLESKLVLQNGMVIPLLTEFLNYMEGDKFNDKQDCEQKAFRRLADRLKREFPRLSIMVLLDGLYANGPSMAICRKNNWDFMIVLKDECLKSVWEEFSSLSKLEPHLHEMNWGNRRQTYSWVNDIEYRYENNLRKRLTVHVVVCQETWQEIDPDTTKPITKRSKHAWLSSKPLEKKNLHERCNLGARHRWSIEEGFLVEKRHGYQYEHCFSYDWTAMRGYHYLMHIGELLNTLAVYSTALAKVVKDLGVRGFIDFVWQTISSPWMDPDYVRERLAGNFQLRFD